MAKTKRRTSSKGKTKSKARAPKTKKASGKVKSSKKSPPKKRTLCQEMIDNQFKPGQSGNPSGRPKGPCITTLRQKDFMRKCTDAPYAEKICKELGLDPDTTTLGELSAAAANMHALIGNAKYYIENLNRDEGKVPDVVVDGNRLSDLFGHLDDEALAALAEKLPNGLPKKGKK